MKKILYELWIDGKIIPFESSKEAYLYYLNNYATEEDFKYYKDCTNGLKSLFDNADDEKLIRMMFDNVFNSKHYIYKRIADDLREQRYRLDDF